MENLPNDLIALALLVFVLGLKHGFDADHLATIDGLTRFHARAHRPFARYCGALFSLGHGLVVLAIALLVSTAVSRWQTPQWLEAFGSWVSIFFLLALSAINIVAVLRTAPDQVVQMVGLKGRFLGRLGTSASPLWVVAVGALFALSFDTISQAALFSLTAAQFGGWREALTLGLVFMLGMLATDGLNGYWISRLIRRADRVALVASRVMSLAVAGVSLLVATFGVLKLSLPGVDAWSEGRELWFGAAVTLMIAGSFFLALRLAANPEAGR